MFLQTEKQFNYRLHYTGDIFRRVVNKISNHLRKTNENLIQDCWKLILKLIILGKISKWSRNCKTKWSLNPAICRIVYAISLKTNDFFYCMS